MHYKEGMIVPKPKTFCLLSIYFPKRILFQKAFKQQGCLSKHNHVLQHNGFVFQKIFVRETEYI